MTSPVATVNLDATTQHAALLLTDNKISAAPVIDADGAVLGIVSEYDLLTKTGSSVREVMTTAVVTVSPDAPVDDIRQLLIERRIRRLPVLAQGRLVGIVSLHDVLATLATEWVCRVCGEPARGEHPPHRCPRCHTSGERFELQEQPPGA